jgi:hypothetical protein
MVQAATMQAACLLLHVCVCGIAATVVHCLCNAVTRCSSLLAACVFCQLQRCQMQHWWHCCTEVHFACNEVVGASCVTCVRASSGCCRFRQPAGMCVMSRPHNRQQHGACAFLHLLRVALCIGLLGCGLLRGRHVPAFRGRMLAFSLVCLLVLADDDCVDYLQTVNSLPRLGWICVYQRRQAALAAAGWLGDSRGCGSCSCPPILSG